METIIIKNKKKQKFKQNYPLIHKEDLTLKTVKTQLGNWSRFLSEAGEFLGYGYLAQQNKGVGWIVSFDEKKPVTQDLLAALFKKAISTRQSFFDSQKTNAFRLFNGEGDGFGGLTIDWYNSYLVISWYNESIYTHRELIIDLLKKELDHFNLQGIYEKNRFQHNNLPDSQFVWGKKSPQPLLVKENDIIYATYLDDGLMTGIFLDQKDVREALSNGLAAGKTVLNTFSYTGAFSVASFVGDAKMTTSVDLAKRSIDKTREQFLVNNINPDSQQIIVMDVFNYFKYAKKKELSFDLVILDPPSFARNKKKTFSVAKDYQKLTKEAVALIRTKGHLVASTNASNVTIEKFEKMVQFGIKDANRKAKKIKTYRLPDDFSVSKNFPEGDYLKVLIYEIE